MKTFYDKILGRRGVAAPTVLVRRRTSDMKTNVPYSALGRLFGAGYTRDAYDPMAFQFRMGAGFFGDVNRTHPFNVEPGLMDATNPPTAYGQAVVLTAAGRIRQVLSTDGALIHIYGITVRPFPFNDPGTSAPYGAQSLGGFTTPIQNQPIDVLRAGYIMTYVNGAPVKGASVYTWIAASASPHFQGFFEQNASGGNTILITPAGSYATTYNGPPDANGCGEVIFEV